MPNPEIHRYADLGGYSRWAGVPAEERSEMQRRANAKGLAKRVQNMLPRLEDEHVIEIFRIIAPRLREVGEILANGIRYEIIVPSDENSIDDAGINGSCKTEVDGSSNQAYEDAALLVWVRRFVLSGQARDWRIDAGLSLHAMARAADLDDSTLSRWERGLSSPRGPMGVRYARALQKLKEMTLNEMTRRQTE